MNQYIEHLDQLLDGELDPMHESALFAELSVNTDLRQELRDHLAIRSAVKDDRMALVPPAMLTNSVFSGLGFAAPFAGAAATTVGSSVVWQWLTRLGIPLLSALTAAGVSWGVASGSFSDFVASSGASVEAPTQQATPPPTPTQTPSTAVAGLSESKTPSSSSEADTEALRASEARAQALMQERNRLLAENAGLRDRIKALEESQTIAQAQPAVETTIPDAESIIVSNVPITSSFQLSNTYTVQRSQDPQTIRLTTFDGGGRPSPFQKFSVQVRGMSLSPTVTSTVSEQTEWYDNLGFAAL